MSNVISLQPLRFIKDIQTYKTYPIGTPACLVGKDPRFGKMRSKGKLKDLGRHFNYDVGYNNVLAGARVLQGQSCSQTLCNLKKDKGVVEYQPINKTMSSHIIPNSIGINSRNGSKKKYINKV